LGIYVTRSTGRYFRINLFIPCRYIPTSPLVLAAPLIIALSCIHLLPGYTTDSTRFTQLLFTLHASLFVPLLLAPSSTRMNENTDAAIPRRQSDIWKIYLAVAVAALSIHYRNTQSLPSASSGMLKHLWATIWTHPAQSSISLDVLWTAATLALWLLASGTTSEIYLKVIATFILSSGVAIKYAGVSIGFILSVIPILGLAGVGGLMLTLSRLRAGNVEKRRVMLEGLGIQEEGVEPGTEKAAPRMRKRRVVVGFWHPYW
jgi:alpha-1,2-mannosyltransferase